MNSLWHAHRSFLYSFGIHLLLGALGFGLYYANHEKAHEEYSKVDLRSLQICTPFVEQSTPKEPVAEACACADEPQLLKPAVKEPKKIPRNKPIVSKTQGVSAVKMPRVQEDKKELQQEEPQEVAEAETDEAVEAVESKAAAVVKEQTQETPAASAVASEPSPSYEARYMQDNVALINALIKQNLNYPRLAKKRGLQGKTIISFTINTQGEVSDIKASGEAAAILKKSARKTIEKASADFPHPETTLALQIPIVYTLN
ncbi:MAG: energy transducer TonB [Campylobacterales bacterium]|nr:energy transducer TonB [Campylobacterales bacterium]